MYARALIGFAAFAALASAPSFAAPPAPQVTVGAGLRQLIFDWDSVPTAASYQLWYKRSSSSSFTVLGSPIAAAQHRARVNISVHKLLWPQARYKVAACNASGCTDSAEIPVQNLMLDAIGYFKASNPGGGDQFGRNFALSPDGKTLVIGAPNEDSGATGVNGDQTYDSMLDAGAAYVFRRDSSGWHQEAYLKPDTVTNEQYFGHGWPLDFEAIAVNANGTLIAIGAPGEKQNGYSFVGKTYIYGRAANGTWSQLQKLGSPALIARDFLYFGEAVDMSEDGNTLRVLELKERDGEGNRQGENHIYARSGNTFVYQTTLTIPHNEVDFCNSGKLSGDGATFVQYCYSYGPEGPRVVTWKRVSTGWMKLPNTLRVLNGASKELALGGAGTRLAFRDSSHPFSSNVRVFGWSGTAWVEEAAIETPAGVDSGYSTWGTALAFDRGGTALAIGDYFGNAGGRGVSDTIQTTGITGGAVFLYARTSSTTNRWRFRKQVKAPNPDYGDKFGLRIAFCGTSVALAIGAIGESSGATGVDGNQLDNRVLSSGAVYLY